MMKRFLIRLLAFIGIPIIVLLAVYLITDPFRTLRPFSFQYFDDTNRDYLSSELYLRNRSVYHYNSFIFGSSRCSKFNTYHWKQHLPLGSRPFLFQAWSETLTGIEQKIDYIDNNGDTINNAIILFDIPGTFLKKQLPKSPLAIKHYQFLGQSKLVYQSCLFFCFSQKPSEWFSSIIRRNQIKEISFDTVSNDWGTNYRCVDVSKQPQKDSLSGCSARSRAVFMKQIENVSENDLKESEPLINEVFIKQLMHIKDVFSKHGTDYRIVISPAYCYTHPKINAKDLAICKTYLGKIRCLIIRGRTT